MVKTVSYFERFIGVSTFIADRCRTRLIANFTEKIFHQLPSFSNIILMVFKLILYMLFLFLSYRVKIKISKFYDIILARLKFFFFK